MTRENTKKLRKLNGPTFGVPHSEVYKHSSYVVTSIHKQIFKYCDVIADKAHLIQACTHAMCTATALLITLHT